MLRTELHLDRTFFPAHHILLKGAVRFGRPLFLWKTGRFSCLHNAIDIIAKNKKVDVKPLARAGKQGYHIHYIKKVTTMEQTLGFIGAGNMASAILSGVLGRDLARPEQVWLSNRSPEKLEPWRARGVHVTLDNSEVAQNAQLLILGVKPQVMDQVLPQIAPFAAGKCVVSIAAGLSSAYLRDRLPGALVVRVMPNTPMKLGKGATAIARAPDVPAENFRLVRALFEAAGVVAVIDESQMDDFIAVSGSSPAFFFSCRIYFLFMRLFKQKKIYIAFQ